MFNGKTYKKLFRGIASAALLLAAFEAAGQEKSILPSVRLPLMKDAPVIDGEVKEAEWQGATRMEGLCIYQSRSLTGATVSSWVGSDDKKLYIAMVSETPYGGKLVAKTAPIADSNSSQAWWDDSIEILFKDGAKDSKLIYWFAVNSRGALTKNKFGTGGGEAWSENFEVKNKVIGDRWHFECAIPLTVLGINSSLEGKDIKLRICRNFRCLKDNLIAQWGASGGAHINPATMPVISWDSSAPVVQMLQIIDNKEKKPKIKLSVYNPGKEAIEVKLDLQMNPKNSLPANLNKALNIEAGKTEILEFAAQTATSGEEVFVSAKVSSMDGKKIYYARDFEYSAHRKEPFFSVVDNDKDRLSFNFAYYPSVNSIKLKVDVSALEKKNEVKGVKVELRKKSDSNIITSVESKEFKNYSLNVEKWKIPDLEEGEYELSLTLDGVKLDAVKESFVRYKFPWENNNIGKSDILIPPYTAIKVDGDSIETILRKHSIDKMGLWKQVGALESKILKHPMRLELSSEGKTYTAEGSGIKWTEKRDTKACGSANWTAGPYSGKVNIIWDYDGLMQWKLELPKSDVQIDSLKLILPVDNSIAPLMHACTDGIRFNYAGYVAAGNGTVWTSAKAARNSIIGTFVPYLWVGGEELGICVTAENDKGWITAKGKPTQEIIRKDDTLELVYNLIAETVKIEEAREIKLAFQATPVKPMPKNWRLKTFGSSPGNALVGAENCTSWFGSCYPLGGVTACMDFYPCGGDMEYLKKLVQKRDTGIIDKEFIEKWIKNYKIELMTEVPAEAKRIEATYRAEINYAFHSLGKNNRFYFNGRGVRFDTPEGQTFLNEWIMFEFSKREFRYPSGVAYDMEPLPSLRDYTLWYFKQMAEICLDSIYFDDLFPAANYNTTLTEAYVRQDGNIQPSVGIYNMREWVRRIAVLYLEMNRVPFNMVHMTNTAMTPVLSFSQTNYTWEDKAGSADFQDRYSRDYIRAESIGLQQGNIPYCLWLVNGSDKKQVEWAHRTGVGVALTHEIKPQGGPSLFWKHFKTMIEFGYGKPEVKVSHYWKKDHPVKFEGIDTSSLVMSKPSSCLVIVCDWGNGGDALMILDETLFKNMSKLKAKDVESGEALPVTEGKVKFNIKKHDHKLILITEE